MAVYGYLINLDYHSKEGEVLWNFQRKESDGSITDYVGIESSYTLETCSDYAIIGNSIDFNEWLIENGQVEEMNMFYGYALISTESIMQTYPELPYETDVNGTTVLNWDIVYDDAYNYALPALLTLEKIKYKPIL